MPKIAASERDAYYEARRRELAEVALRLWAEHGFDQTSVAAIAREAGVSKGSFYLYFSSKDALLEDVFRRNSLLPDVQRLVGDLADKPLEEAVHGFVRGAYRHLCDNRELVLLFMRELPTHLEQSEELFARLIVPANRVLAAYLEARIPPERAEQLSLLIGARSLLGMVVTAFLTQEILGARKVLPIPDDEVAASIAEIFLHGVQYAPASDQAS